MKTFVKSSLLVLATALASSAMAQETAEQASEEFPIGTKPEIKVGQVYLVETKGDWNVRCMKTAEGDDPCHIHQVLKDERGNSVAEISFFHLPGGGAAVAGATATTPLGTLLQAQLTFKIDESPAKQYPFNWCEAVGCISRMGFTGLELELLKKGSNASVTIASVVSPTQPVTVPVSLTGFSDGFRAVLVKPK